MVQKIHLRCDIWVQSFHPQAGHLSGKKNDNLAVQYEDVHGYTNRWHFATFFLVESSR